MADPIDTIKRAAAEAIAADKPVQLLFGTVISAAPLKIQLDQKATLLEPMLVLTRNVTDYEMDIDVSHWTEFEKEHQHSTSDGATALPTSHRHKYVGIKKVKIHNAMLEGDVVVLARIQKGKRYVVLDRISPIPELKGEWL